MRVALLSHRGGNIGHDFMAVGWEEIVRSAFGADTRISHVEQHRPFSVYPPFHPARVVDRVKHGRAAGLRRLATRHAVSGQLTAQARPPEVDLAVGCGGPNIVSGAGRSPEMATMFHALPAAFQRRGIPVVDAAVGSAYAWERRPERIDDPEDRRFWETAFSVTSGGTVRDPLAQRLWRDLGREAPLIPCGAIASGRRMQAVASETVANGTQVVVNFQERGANTDWDQGVDADLWAATVRDLVARLSTRHRVVLLCHNEWESRLARRLGSGLDIRQPRTVDEYAAAIAGSSAAFVNRLHAAIPLAGCGVPSLVIGTDTRLLAAEQMGLPILFVKDATADGIEAQVEDLLARRTAECDRLVALREATVEAYADVLRETLRSD